MLAGILLCTTLVLQVPLLTSGYVAWTPTFAHHSIADIRQRDVALRLNLNNDDGVNGVQFPSKRNENDGRRVFYVHVSYDENFDEIKSQQPSKQGIDIPVFEGETILAALERASSAGNSGDGTRSQRNKTTENEKSMTTSTSAIIPPPSDCRRGNCMTCTARHYSNSRSSNVESHENGLSPYVADRITEQGYILTCCSTVTGPGVSLSLGKHNQLWDYVYRQRWEAESTQAVARAAMAKAIRLSAEQNVQEWAKQTERAYRSSRE